MMFNRENYEAFLIDMIEGNLPENLERDLLAFLADNPDLVPSNDLLDFHLVPVETEFPFKENLKKGGLNEEINKSNYQQFCIAAIEGDLPVFMEKRLYSFLAENPELAISASAYRQLILKPDNSLVFPNKEHLKTISRKKSTLPWYMNKMVLYQTVSVAASVAVLISAFFFLRNEQRADMAGMTTAGQEINVPIDPVAVFDIRQKPDSDIFESTDTDIIEPFVLDYYPSITLVKINESDRSVDPVYVMQEATYLSHPGFREPEMIFDLAGIKSELFRTSDYLATNRSLKEVKTGAGAIIVGLVNFVARNFDEDMEQSRLNLWDIADAGFQGINTLTGSDLRLERDYNQDGELVSLGFSSRIIEIRRSSGPAEE